MGTEICTDTATHEEILSWAEEEVRKEAPSSFKFEPGTDELRLERGRLLMYRKRRYIYDEGGRICRFLLNHGFSRRVIFNHIDKKAKEFYDSLIAECLTVENDGKDSIIFYPDNVLYIAGLFKERRLTIKELSLGFIKHEIRHAKQFEALREVGVSPLLALNLEAMDYSYGEGPLEKDAYFVQFHDTETQTVEEVAQNIKDELIKKGWIS